MFFLCPSTPIVSVFFLIELNLFCFLDLYLVMILAGVNFMVWLHIPMLRADVSQSEAHQDKADQCLTHPKFIDFSDVQIFFYPTNHHILLSISTTGPFSALPYSHISEQASMQSKWLHLPCILLLLTIEHGATLPVIWGEIRLLMPISYSTQEIQHSSAKYLTNLSPSHIYLSEPL